MPLATGNQFHAFNWTELTIDDYIIGRVEGMERYDNQPIITNIYPIAGTNNPGGTQKPYNPLKGIRIPIPQDPDNLLKGIQYLVKNGTRSQWPRGFTITT